MAIMSNDSFLLENDPFFEKWPLFWTITPILKNDPLF